eukprot:Tamp_14667.p1 GENE.Tamp_14667~~Tamp_14667.p1  ORF type:complete len:477 (+),score=45.22 Tamp_14667:100-1431(+)
MAVVIDSQSPPTCRQKSVDSEEAGGTVAQAESSMNPDGQGHVGENRLMHSSQQPTPTEREEKEGLERLLDALTPQEQNSPQKRASTVRSSVGFRRSMRTSLSIQLGIVPSSPAVGVGSAVVTSNHSKSSSSGLGGSSRFRALGALSSSGEPTPVTAGSRDKAQVSVPRSSGSQGEAARRPASREQHLPATPNPPGEGDSPAIRGTEGMAVGAATAGSDDVITTRDPINPNYQVHASSGSHTLKLEAGCGGEEGKGVADWGLETRSSFRHDQMEDTDQCLIGSIAPAARVEILRACAASAVPQAEAEDNSVVCQATSEAGAPGGLSAWGTAEIAGGDGGQVLEGSLSLQRARREWASLSVDDQLSLTKGFFNGARGGGSGGAGHSLSNVDLARESVSAGPGAGGGQGDGERDLEEGSMELIYDPNLGVFFDPKTNAFFMREAVG